MLIYNGSNPSLLKISVEIQFKTVLCHFAFLQTALVSFEAVFDSTYHILHNSKADLWQ